MTNKDKYDQVFMESFSISQEQLGDSLEYQSISNWDSIGHIGMIASLEESFKIALDTDDVIDFSSYKKGMQILSKYGIAV